MSENQFKCHKNNILISFKKNNLVFRRILCLKNVTCIFAKNLVNVGKQMEVKTQFMYSLLISDNFVIFDIEGHSKNYKL